MTNAENNANQNNKSAPKQKPRRSKLRKFLYATILLLTLLVVAGWFYLPVIAERVITKIIADAGLDKSELRVNQIGWNEATIEDISLADDGWKIELKQAHIHYNPFDLLKGKTKDITLNGLKITANLENENPPETDPNKPSGLAIIHTLPASLESIGTIDIHQAELTLLRGDKSLTRRIDVQLDHSISGEITTTLTSSDFKLHLHQVTKDTSSTIDLQLQTEDPFSFINMMKFITNNDDELIPDGLTFSAATLTTKLTIEEDYIPGINLSGKLTDVIYKVGDNFTTTASKTTNMLLSIDSDGLGSLKFSGKLAAINLDLNPETKFRLQQLADQQASWKFKLIWGSDDGSDGISGDINDLHLNADYQGQAITLSSETLHFNRYGDTVHLSGTFINNSVKLPFSSNFEYRSTSKTDWHSKGIIQLGPVIHNAPLPILSAVSDLFEDLTITAGKSNSRFNFTASCEQGFEGKLVTKLENASVKVTDDMVIATGVNGEFKYYMPPPVDGQPSVGAYNFNFTTKELSIDTQDALDYQLKHPEDSPITLTGRGVIRGDDSYLDGTISGLNNASLGSIEFNKTPITKSSSDQRVHLGIAQVPEGRGLFSVLSVEDNILLGAYTRKDTEVSQDLEEIYQKFPILKEKRAEYAGTLSGGQQQMVAVGRALMSRPKLLLLDEPSMGLAPVIVEDIFSAIMELRDKGVTIFIVEQNAFLALEHSDRTYVMENGTIVAEGRSKEMLHDESIIEAYLGG